VVTSALTPWERDMAWSRSSDGRAPRRSKISLASGIPLESVGAAIQHGALSLGFLDAASFERFARLRL